MPLQTFCHILLLQHICKANFIGAAFHPNSYELNNGHMCYMEHQYNLSHAVICNLVLCRCFQYLKCRYVDACRQARIDTIIGLSKQKAPPGGLPASLGSLRTTATQMLEDMEAHEVLIDRQVKHKLQEAVNHENCQFVHSRLLYSTPPSVVTIRSWVIQQEEAISWHT